MRDIKEISRKVMWVKSPLDGFARSAIINLPCGIRANLVVGMNEGGLEHVSISLCARRLPTWEEMCFIKDIFWDDEEEVVQIHPRKSEYVNMTEALHLWRPVDGDWSRMNHVKEADHDES